MSSTGESEELIEALEASTSSSTESAQDVGSEATPTEGNEEERTKSLDKSKLCSIAAQLEAELEAFHFVLSSLKVIIPNTFLLTERNKIKINHAIFM